MKLAKNERPIKVWKYGSRKIGKVETDLSVVVTNKRIIQKEESANAIKMNEVAVKDVTGLSSSFSKASLAKGITAIVIGAILAIVGLIFAVADVSVAVGLIMLGLGIVAVVLGILYIVKRPVAFSITLFTDAKNTQNYLIGFGAAKGKFAARRKRTIKLKVDEDVANEMIDVIGSVIINIRELGDAIVPAKKAAKVAPAKMAAAPVVEEVEEVEEEEVAQEEDDDLEFEVIED